MKSADEITGAAAATDRSHPGIAPKPKAQLLWRVRLLLSLESSRGGRRAPGRPERVRFERRGLPENIGQPLFVRNAGETSGGLFRRAGRGVAVERIRDQFGRGASPDRDILSRVDR